VITYVFCGLLIGHLLAELETAMVWVKIVKIQADARVLADAMVLTISEHGGPVQAAGTEWERVRP
jgi:hypothetical protein